MTNYLILNFSNEFSKHLVKDCLLFLKKVIKMNCFVVTQVEIGSFHVTIQSQRGIFPRSKVRNYPVGNK